MAEDFYISQGTKEDKYLILLPQINGCLLAKRI